MGFLIQIEEPNPGSTYALTRLSSIRGGDHVDVVHLGGSSASAMHTAPGYIYGEYAGLDLAIIEINAKWHGSLALAEWERLSQGDTVFSVGLPRGEGTEGGSIQGVVQTPQEGVTSETPFTNDAFSWPLSEGRTFDPGSPIVDSEGRVLGIVAALDPARGNLPLSVPLSLDLLYEIIRRTENRASVLETTPGTPIAGRETSFTLQVEPGRLVRLTHLGPGGEAAPWVFPIGLTRKEDGKPILDKLRAADAGGLISWTRPGSLDQAGRWTLRVEFDPYSVAPHVVELRYTVYGLELAGTGRTQEGIPWNSIHKADLSLYYSDSVPTAFASDAESTVRSVHRAVQDLWEVEVPNYPDVYLVGTEAESDMLNEYLGIEFSYGGLHRRPGSSKLPGIVINVWKLSRLARFRSVLAHELAHRIFHAESEGKTESHPAWINEGLAEWSEFTAIAEKEGQPEVYQWRAQSMDSARSNASAGTLFSLEDIESQKVWNRREGDRKTLQYQQAHMAILYMFERFGQRSIIDFARKVSSHHSLGRGFALELGTSYREFESDFLAWLGAQVSSETHYEAGEDLFDSEEYSLAVGEYTAAIELNPYRASYFRSRGWAYERLDQDENALQDANQVIQINPGDPGGYNLRGWAFYGLERYEEAIADFSRAIELNPLNNYYRGRGNAYDRLAQYEQALADFGRAIRLDPNYALTYRERGWTYYRTDRYEDALQDANQAVKLEPGDRWNYRLRGRALAKLERYAEAVSDFSRAIDLHPHEVIYFDRGRAHYKLAQYDRALADFGEAIRIDPNYAFAYDWRAAAHGKLGNEAQKLADRQSACSIDNSFWFC